MIYETDIDFKLTYTVKKVIRRYNNGQRLVEIKVVDMEGYPRKTGFPSELTGIGLFSVINQGDTFTSTTKFVFDKKRGYFFAFQGLPTRMFPATQKEVSKYLSSHISGLGKKTADTIVDIVGVSAITKIPQNPEVLDQVPKLGSRKKANIISWCQDNYYSEQVLLYLYQHGVPLDIAQSLYDRFGKLAIARLQDNPYSIYESGTIPFWYAEKIASNLHMPWNDSNRIQCAVRAAIDQRIDSHGDTCVLQDQIIDLAEEYLSKSKFYDPQVCRSSPAFIFPDNVYQNAIKNLQEAGELIPYTYNNELYFYRKATFHAETFAAEKIKTMLNADPALHTTKNQLTRYLQDSNPELSDEQIEAVIMAARHKFSILTGGPGTGKTFTMKALIQTLQHFRPEIKIAQAAPTAKAAAKMREVTGLDADTIHATFRMTPVKFGKTDDFILDTDFLIIDETSMIGIELFADILKKISDKTCILMVGDPMQLPSISCGDVLRKIIESKVVPVSELSKIYRQASSSTIIRNAHRIRSGDISRISQMEKFSKTTGNNKNFIFLKGSTDEIIADKIVGLIKKLVFTNRVSLDEIMVLTPVHATACGTDSLNGLLQDLLNPAAPGKAEFARGNGFLGVFRVGDRVINTKNFKLKREGKPAIKVKNGDIGVISDVIPESGVVVTFSNLSDPIKFTNSKIEYLDLAYAITVHKAQGSEAAFVIMPFSTSYKHDKMLTKSLIYTGLTRASEYFCGVGDWSTFLSHCSIVNTADERLSLFNVFLQTKA